MRIRSVQPRKQRAYVYNAPLHTRQKLVHAALDKKLRKEYGRRSLALRKGDKVEVMRGSFAGVRGEIKEVDLKDLRVTVDGVKRKKADGTEVQVRMHPSNLRIIEALVDDKKRARIIERSGGKVTLTKKKTEKEAKAAHTEGVKCPLCSETFENNAAANVHVTEKHKEYAQQQ
ncbi:MAG: 50S ribosomal protein L24 [Candidatus Aenigmatarchaeota archaeon]|nr:MAG: 50S ribosomal protein L24 [Candidatus Aenigmarchaeota archaeon]